MNPTCPVHNQEMTLRPAGIAKTTGKPYEAFWTCSGKNADGSYCRFKLDSLPTPVQVNQSVKLEEKKSENINWMNARTAAVQIVIAMYNKDAITPAEFESYIIQLTEKLGAIMPKQPF